MPLRTGTAAPHNGKVLRTRSRNADWRTAGARSKPISASSTVWLLIRCGTHRVSTANRSSQTPTTAPKLDRSLPSSRAQPTSCPARSPSDTPAAATELRLPPDRPRLHGPYRHWSRKIANKTGGKYLNKDQAHDAQRWIDNDRRIRELLARLEQIGIERLGADQPRT